MIRKTMGYGLRAMGYGLILTLGCGGPAQEVKKEAPKLPPVATAERVQPEPAPAAPRAATVDPWAGRTDLIAQPTPAPAKEIDVGKVEIFKLRNGLSVVLVPRADLPKVDLGLTIRAGKQDDPAGKESLAQWTASMLTKGTKTRSADDISSTIEQLGGSLGATAGGETLEVGCGALAKDLETCLELLADVSLHPKFDPKEMDEVQQQLLGGVKQALDQPAQLAELHLANQLFGDDHPRGRPMTEESVKSVTEKDMKAFWGKWFVPNNAWLSVAGQFDAKAVRKSLEKRFGGWKKGKVEARKTPELPAIAAMRVLLVDKPGLNQTQIRLAHAGVSFGDEDRLAVKLMNYTLGGGGFSSRLMKVIRSEKGKTYGINTRFDEPLLGKGGFSVSTFTRTEEVGRTISDVLGVIEKYRAEGPSDDELVHAKGNVTGSYPQRIESPNALADAVVGALMRGKTIQYVKKYTLELDAVTREQAKAAADRRLDPKHLVIVLVGDGKALAPVLAAANLSFDRVAYSEPVSAKTRALAVSERKEKAGVKVDSATADATHKLVSAMLVAAGGEAELRKVKDVVAKMDGKLQIQGQEIPISMTISQILPGKTRMEIGAMGQMQTIVLTEDGGFAMAMGQLQELPPEMAKKQRKGSGGSIPGLKLLEALDKKHKLVGKPAGGEVDGKKVDLLEVIDADGDASTMFVDPQTHRVIKSVSDKTTAKLSDYKAMGGFVVPCTIQVDGQQKIELKLTDLKVNTGVKSELFKKPSNQ